MVTGFVIIVNLSSITYLSYGVSIARIMLNLVCNYANSY